MLILFQGFGFGLGLIFSTLNVFLRDIGQALVIALQLWMWLTPIVYVEQILPPGLQAVHALQPRLPVHRRAAPHDRARASGRAPWQWPVDAALGARRRPWLGYLVLRRLRPEIRDVL